MPTVLFIAAALLSIAAGLYALITTFRLYKKYGLGHLSTYLYSQVFLGVFGIYGILGKDITQKILEQQASSLQTIEKIGHFFSFLGLPFLIFGWYMLIRLCREIADKQLSRAFTLGYFFVLAAIFSGYGAVIIVLNLSRWEAPRIASLSSAYIWTYAVLEALVLTAALLPIFTQAGRIEDKNKQKAARMFALQIMLFFGASLVVFLLVGRRSRLVPLYLLAFFLRNFPPVLCWKSHLRKHTLAPSLRKAGLKTWQQFLEAYDISKREEEVIRQLCEGKSNKEISRALFISLQTVKDHVYRIYQKTDVRNRVQLINLIQGFQEETVSRR
jgi:DNA-binding CsgD family transcriptional regulator